MPSDDKTIHPSTPEKEPTAEVPVMNSGDELAPKVYAGRKSAVDSETDKKNILWTTAAVGGALLVGLFLFSHKEVPGQKKQEPRAVTQAKAVKAVPSGSSLPSDKAQTSTDAQSSSLSAKDIENTRAKAGTGDPQAGNGPRSTVVGASGSHVDARKPLSTIPAFQQPRYQVAGQGSEESSPAYAGMSQQESKAYIDEVTKPSLIFTAQESGPASSAGASSQGSTVTNDTGGVTNFGLQPGFHVTTHLESAASTFGGTPAVAIVKYNYVKDGVVLIPAGSRMVGRINGGSQTGAVAMAFNEVYFPDGSRVPIDAVGLNDKLQPLKGKVTGRQTAKQFILTTLASVGTVGAGFLGTNNTNAISQQGLARDQIASNLGNAADQTVQQIQVNQQLVVTVAAGTTVEVTFVTPKKVGPRGISATASK